MSPTDNIQAEAQAARIAYFKSKGYDMSGSKKVVVEPTTTTTTKKTKKKKKIGLLLFMPQYY
jgi:hypothetical protein